MDDGDRTSPAGSTDLTRLGEPACWDAAVALLAATTDALLDDVRELDDDAVRAPSLLPGWSRGHVLTHVARNADGLGRLLTWARTGEPESMYASAAGRDADIAAGAGRGAAELEADVEASAERFLAQLAALPADRRDVPLTPWSGLDPVPAHVVLWFRLREVGYHHLDLALPSLPAGPDGTGRPRRFRDLPAAVVARGLPEALARTGVDPAAAGVHGEPGDLLGWLTGREDGADLRAEHGLPVVPSWG